MKWQIELFGNSSKIWYDIPIRELHEYISHAKLFFLHEEVMLRNSVTYSLPFFRCHIILLSSHMKSRLIEPMRKECSSHERCFRPCITQSSTCDHGGSFGRQKFIQYFVLRSYLHEVRFDFFFRQQANLQDFLRVNSTHIIVILNLSKSKIEK